MYIYSFTTKMTQEEQWVKSTGEQKAEEGYLLNTFF